jgi:hypothetical protein
MTGGFSEAGSRIELHEITKVLTGQLEVAMNAR